MKRDPAGPMGAFRKATGVWSMLAAVSLSCAEQAGVDNPSSVAAVEAITVGEGDVVLTAAGNIATCGGSWDERTAQLLDALPGFVVTLGDNALPDGLAADYQNCYHPTWGRHQNRTYPVLGNHDYDAGNADGSFDYWGERAGPRGLGYYSFDLGSWHVIVLNDNGAYVPFGAGSAQEQWLKNDLAANSQLCTVALWHIPLFLSSGTTGYNTNSSRRVLWTALYEAGADLVLNGDPYGYERMAPMRPDGTRDDARGIRQFTVGTGGQAVGWPPTALHPNSEARGRAYGVLTLTLRADGYDWQFLPGPGWTFTDSGSGTCH